MAPPDVRCQPQQASIAEQAASAFISRRGQSGRRGEQSRAESVLAAGRLTIRSEHSGSVCVVAVSGELDLATARAVEDELQAAEVTDAEQIILDLSALGFIDCTGVHLVISAAARSRADGNRLRLRRGSQHVQRIFEITGMTA